MKVDDVKFGQRIGCQRNDQPLDASFKGNCRKQCLKDHPYLQFEQLLVEQAVDWYSIGLIPSLRVFT